MNLIYESVRTYLWNCDLCLWIWCRNLCYLLKFQTICGFISDHVCWIIVLLIFRDHSDILITRLDHTYFTSWYNQILNCWNATCSQEKSHNNHSMPRTNIITVYSKSHANLTPCHYIDKFTTPSVSGYKMFWLWPNQNASSLTKFINKYSNIYITKLVFIKLIIKYIFIINLLVENITIFLYKLD